MKRIKFERESGMSSFRLAKLVGELEPKWFRVGQPKCKVSVGCLKAVFRALADRYPRIWPSVETIAENAGFRPTQTRLALRVLEQQQGWIADVFAAGAKRPKSGGKGNTVQYRINVAKVLEAHDAQGKEFEAGDEMALPVCLANPTDAAPNPTGSEPKATAVAANPTDSDSKATDTVGEQRSETEKEQRSKREKGTAPEQSSHLFQVNKEGQGLEAAQLIDKLLFELTLASDSEVTFENKYKLLLTDILSRSYTVSEIVIVFKEFYSHIQGDDFLIKQAAKKFCETAMQLMDVRRYQIEKLRKLEVWAAEIEKRQKAEMGAEFARLQAEEAEGEAQFKKMFNPENAQMTEQSQ